MFQQLVNLLPASNTPYTVDPNMSHGAPQSAAEALYQPYDQFILFGDSITQMSSNQERGFGLQPALQDGQITPISLSYRIMLIAW